ncbi:MAG: eight-cysteine-cluster domain-containing protein [Pseudomonadota bacterium]
MHLVALFVLFACNVHTENSPPPEAAAALAVPVQPQAIPEAEPASPVGREPPTVPLPVDSPPPAALYDQCHDRLEGRGEQDGECAVDSDCATAGCSQEVCVPAAKKGDVITTCEILPCFGAVEACGCHEGRCTWTLRTELQPQLPRIPIKIGE